MEVAPGRRALLRSFWQPACSSRASGLRPGLTDRHEAVAYKLVRWRAPTAVHCLQLPGAARAAPLNKLVGARQV